VVQWRRHRFLSASVVVAGVSKRQQMEYDGSQRYFGTREEALARHEQVLDFLKAGVLEEV
jgi:hypothetical protein